MSSYRACANAFEVIISIKDIVYRNRAIDFLLTTLPKCTTNLCIEYKVIWLTSTLTIVVRIFCIGYIRVAFRIIKSRNPKCKYLWNIINKIKTKTMR